MHLKHIILQGPMPNNLPIFFLPTTVCPRGQDIANGIFVVAGNYRYNVDITQTSTLTYSCNAGFTLVGTARLRCTQPNPLVPPNWDADPPRCVPGTYVLQKCRAVSSNCAEKIRRSTSSFSIDNNFQIFRHQKNGFIHPDLGLITHLLSLTAQQIAQLVRILPTVVLWSPATIDTTLTSRRHQHWPILAMPGSRW